MIRHLSLSRCVLAAVLGLLPSVAAGQVVRGHVVDSVSTTPLVGAAVLLLDSAGSEVDRTIAEPGGEFLLEAAAATYRLRVVHPGYRTTTFPPFALGVDEVTSYRLLVPQEDEGREIVDFETVTKSVCGSAAADLAIIAGWIRNGKTGAIDPEAVVSMSWSAVPAALSEQLSLSDFSGVVAADTNGYYAICGTPVNRKISLHAMSPHGLSEFYNLTFADGGVIQNGDYLASPVRVWRHDMLILEEDQRHAAIAGTVTDAATHDPVSGAEVEIVGTPFAVLTDGQGTFAFQAVPPGPAKLRIRRVGSQILQREIVVPERDSLTIPPGLLALGNGPTALDPITVETTAPVNPLAEFYARREKANGSFITREEFMAMGNPRQTTDVLTRMQGVRVEPSGDLTNPFIISMVRGGPRSFGYGAGGVDPASGASCPPLYFVDRQYIGNAADIALDAAVPVGDIEAIEAHRSVASLPTEFNRRGAACGVIAIWTRHAELRPVPVTPPEERKDPTLYHLLFGLTVVVGIFFLVGKAIHF
jgi:Carboxypeptidase regulatory-like domain